METLKTGAPCPCCGEPIRWKSERILQLLTYAAEGMLAPKGLEEMLSLMEKEKADNEALQTED